MTVPTPVVPFLVRLADGRTLAGAEFTPGGFVCVHTPDAPAGICTIATSVDALLADRPPAHSLHGATIEPCALETSLTASIAAARARLGPDDCGCGGCDACAQHRLLDTMAEVSTQTGADGDG